MQNFHLGEDKSDNESTHTNQTTTSAPLNPNEGLPAPDAKKVDKQYRIVLWLVALGFFMQALDSTIVNTALPTIAHSLQVDPLQMHHVVVVYVLMVAALIPASGWLADRLGIRTVYLAAITIFTLASLGCGLAQSYEQLILGRLFQGVGGAFLLPVGRLALLRILPRQQFLAAMGFIALPGLVGPLLGPALGGFLVEYASWHWIFLINLPIGLLGFIFTLTHMPNMTLADLPAFDYRGFALLAMSMVCLTLGLEHISQGPIAGGAVMFVLLVFGVMSIVAYIRHARRDSRAIFRADLFENMAFRLGIIGNIVSRMGSGAMPFILPMMLQLALGFTPLQAGLMMIPLVLGAMTVKQLATRAIRRFGYYRVLSINTLLVGLGIMSFALLNQHQNIYSQSVHLFLFGCVNSMQFTAMNTLTLKDLNQAQSANGNSLLSMVMNMSMSLSVALVGVMLYLFAHFIPQQGVLWSFQASFITLGMLTMWASLVFRQLKRLPAFA